MLVRLALVVHRLLPPVSWPIAYISCDWRSASSTLRRSTASSLSLAFASTSAQVRSEFVLPARRSAGGHLGHDPGLPSHTCTHQHRAATLPPSMTFARSVPNASSISRHASVKIKSSPSDLRAISPTGRAQSASGASRQRRKSGHRPQVALPSLSGTPR